MSDTKLIMQKCPACFAPIEVGQMQAEVKCAYCGNVVRVERKRPLLGRPAQKPLTIYMPAKRSAWVWLTPLIIVAAAVIPSVLGGFRGKGGNGFRLSKKISAFPAHCGMNEEVEVDHVDFDGKGVLITAEMNCHILIRDSRLTGETIVQSKGMNVDLSIENSKLIATKSVLQMEEMGGKVLIKNKSILESQDVVVLLGANAKLEVRNSQLSGKVSGAHLETNAKVQIFEDSLVQGGEVGLSMGGNGEAKLDHSRVSSKENAIKTAGNASLHLSNQSRVDAKETAILTESNPHFSIRDSVVESDRDAIVGGFAASVEVRNATVTATRYAFWFKSKPYKFITSETTVKGAYKNQ